MALDQAELSQDHLYRIRLKGIPDRSIVDWFSAITIFPHENGETVVVGRFTDQPALRGFLNHLWNLNFTVLSVERIENEHDQ